MLGLCLYRQVRQWQHCRVGSLGRHRHPPLPPQGDCRHHKCSEAQAPGRTEGQSSRSACTARSLALGSRRLRQGYTRLRYPTYSCAGAPRASRRGRRARRARWRWARGGYARATLGYATLRTVVQAHRGPVVEVGVRGALAGAGLAASTPGLHYPTYSCAGAPRASRRGRRARRARWRWARGGYARATLGYATLRTVVQAHRGPVVEVGVRGALAGAGLAASTPGLHYPTYSCAGAPRASRRGRRARRARWRWARGIYARATLPYVQLCRRTEGQSSRSACAARSLALGSRRLRQGYTRLRYPTYSCAGAPRASRRGRRARRARWRWARGGYARATLGYATLRTVVQAHRGPVVEVGVRGALAGAGLAAATPGLH
ncbi:unnamed protein product [Arctia plantaginis]|uniref:Uncharacterized protein n=1 Tax=Arctia plantaginis TaxID=874455 RepID=A0A8S1AA80_ARCPL|nr:unnamed protein product [Arctia plantaginis]